MGDLKDLLAYKKGYSLAMEIFTVTKTFPKEEQHSLTDQIRRSSRSVCTNLGEAYRKRGYPAHVVSKLSDADAENAETGIWLDFAKDCQYISETVYTNLVSKNTEVGKLIWFMLNNSDKFL